jgi:hypothetical protein
MTGCIRKINSPINQVQPVATSENIQDNFCMDASINVASEIFRITFVWMLRLMWHRKYEDNMDASINVGSENIQDNLCMASSINVGSENIQDNLCMDASINVGSENIQDNFCMASSINVASENIQDKPVRTSDKFILTIIL